MSTGTKEKGPAWLYAALVGSMALLGTAIFTATAGFTWMPSGSGWTAIIAAGSAVLGTLYVGQAYQNHKEALAAKSASEAAERELKREMERLQISERRTAAQAQKANEIRDGHAVTETIAQQLIDAVMRDSGCLEDPMEWLKFTVDGVSQPIDMEGLLQELNAQPLRDLGRSAAEAKALRHACKEMLDRYRESEKAAQTHRDRGEDFEPWKGKFIGEARHGTFGAREALAALIAKRDRTIEEIRSEPT